MILGGTVQVVINGVKDIVKTVILVIACLVCVTEDVQRDGRDLFVNRNAIMVHMGMTVTTTVVITV